MKYLLKNLTQIFQLYSVLATRFYQNRFVLELQQIFIMRVCYKTAL